MKTVLVVDDSKTIRTAVRWTLRGPDFDLLEAKDGAEALRVAESARPDVILVDAQLNGDEGLELCSTLKRSPRLAGVPVLLLTNALRPVDPARWRAALADGCIDKPFETQALIDWVRARAGLPADDVTPSTYAGRLARQRSSHGSASESSPPAPVDGPPARFASPASPSTRLPAPAPVPESSSSMGFEVSIEEAEPVEIDASDPTFRPSPAEGAPSGPSLEPPPSPNERPHAVDVDVWALAESEGAGPSRDPSAPRGTTLDRAADTVAAAAASRADLGGLPLEELRSIAREVIEAVAWEVVPDLAETIIREELSRLTSDRP